jgi:lysophospholipase L1-like esterase
MCTAGGALAAKGGKGGGGGGGGNGGGKGGGKDKGGGGDGGGTDTALYLEGAGDSIMRGYNASCTRNTGLFDFLCYGGGDQPENSFLDGSSSSVVSVRDWNLTITPTVQSHQAAVSGSEMVDPAKTNFAYQAEAIVASATTAARVFVELGGNDICNRATVEDLYSDSDWEQAVDAGLEILTDGLPDGSTVIVVSVPRVQDLRAAGIALENSSSRVDCQAFWSSFDVCPIATADDSATAAIDERQQRYNEILQARAEHFNSLALSGATQVEVVTDYQGESAGSIGTYSFQAQDLNGGDCFHPSIQGHNTIAEMLWDIN